MNKVTLIGRWARDIELKPLESGKYVARCTVAVSEGYGDRKKTHFLDVVLWNKTAENAASYSGKGKRVAIHGRIDTREYMKDDQKVRVFEIVADEVEFLESKEQVKASAPAYDESDVPF